MNHNISSAVKQEKEFLQSEILAAELERQCQAKARQKSMPIYAPLPLQRESKPPKPYPFDSLGPIVGKAAQRIHEVVQAPDATCGQSVLAALSLACQSFIDVEIDGRVSPASLFMLTISESGERKSGTDKIALYPIYTWQKMLVRQHKKNLLDYKDAFDIWKKKRETAIKAASESSDKENSLNLEQEPQQPSEGLILCEEPTLEGLERLLEKGQPSVGIFSDEGGRLVGGHAMNADNALKTACGLSNLWDGKPLTRVRKSEGSQIYYGRRLAMHLMIQPIVLKQLIDNKILMGQGLLSRCLFSAPMPLAGSRKYKEVDLHKDPIILDYYSHINKILDRPYPKINNREIDIDGLTPTPVLLEAKAKKRWIDFHDTTDIKMGEDKEFYPIKPFASKASEQVLRIGAIFAFSESIALLGKVLQIEEHHIERAIMLVEYYLGETLRILNQGENYQNMNLAIKTLEWIRRCYPDQVFPLSDVYQYGPYQVRNSDKAKEILQILESHDHVTRVSNAIIGSKHVRSAWRLVS